MGPNASDPSWLDKVFEWFLNADTQIAILLFLSIGVVSLFWTLAIKPLLLTFSSRYRVYNAMQALDAIRPLLQELGILDEAKRIRSLKKLKLAQMGTPDVVLRTRLLEIMKEYYTDNEILLGRLHSVPNLYFIDLRAAATILKHRKLLADILSNSIAGEIRRNLANSNFREYNRIVGMKEGNPLISADVAEKLQLPFTLYRGTHFPRFHNSLDPTDFFDGQIIEKENVILVDDATFRGTTLIEATKAIESLNAKVVGVFLLFEPDLNTARASFEKLSIPFHAIVTVNKSLQKKLKS